MTTREILSRELDEAPDNQSLRLVLADVMDEEGEAEYAAGMRWQVQYAKWPLFKKMHDGEFYWFWYWEDEENHHCIRYSIVKKSSTMLDHPLGFTSRRAAEAALAQALLAAGEISVKGVASGT